MTARSSHWRRSSIAARAGERPGTVGVHPWEAAEGGEAAGGDGGADGLEHVAAMAHRHEFDMVVVEEGQTSDKVGLVKAARPWEMEWVAWSAAGGSCSMLGL